MGVRRFHCILPARIRGLETGGKRPVSYGIVVCDLRWRWLGWPTLPDTITLRIRLSSGGKIKVLFHTYYYHRDEEYHSL